MSLSKCCVCGQKNYCLTVKSTCSDKLLDYCAACVSQRYENYDELVNYGFPFELFNKQFQEKVVIPTLRYYNKTVEQFNRDVEDRKGSKNG